MVTEMFINHLKKKGKKSKKKAPIKQHYSKRLFFKNTQQNKGKKTPGSTDDDIILKSFFPSVSSKLPEGNLPSAKMIPGNAWEHREFQA